MQEKCSNRVRYNKRLLIKKMKITSLSFYIQKLKTALLSSPPLIILDEINIICCGHGQMNYKDTKLNMSVFLSVDLLTDFAAFCLTDFID